MSFFSSIATFFSNLEPEVVSFFDTVIGSEVAAVTPILTQVVSGVETAVITNAVTPSGIGEAVSVVLKAAEAPLAAAAITAGAGSLLTAVGNVLATAQAKAATPAPAA